ncbi:unnamed protein product [Spirodela intermedia]|uniref:non-specific serine/threonine protein kinase n=1 Tax=Spirodela intermedia TaxID=51605 RepID=A0A7I8KNU9_SPIIN|nr:unnamed protein product [Spirodela intermedia]
MAGARLGKRTPEENVVMVAVKAEREMSKMALSWALTHVVRPGDIVTLLAVIPNHYEGQRRRLWSFPKFAGECGSGGGGGSPESRRKAEVSALCSRMALQFHARHDPQAPHSAGGSGGAVVAEWKRVGANWIVLDKQLKQEAKHCMQELPDCSIVLMKRTHAKVLRLNLRGGGEKQSSREEGEEDDDDDDDDDDDNEEDRQGLYRRLKHSTPASSPEDERTATNGGSSSVVCYRDPSSGIKTLQEIFIESGGDSPADRLQPTTVRPAVRRRSSSTAVAPPLCSVCRHRAPVFGKPPRWFGVGELEEATGGFCDENFLAEDALTWVHRGVLRNGQVVAVKRLKPSPPAAPGMMAVYPCGGGGGDGGFRAEVEVLSRAQHRNVVMLVGFSVEATQRALVYEYVCNGSLAAHLHGRAAAPPLDWPARLRIAVGTARGLRYLHEDCRVGFIHGDVRPSNILLTHDFEPLIADFGFSRWQPEGGGAGRRMLGKFGYLAPEYIERGRITEKADVYAFGVVLLELLTGRRAVDAARPKGQQFLAEWSRRFSRRLIAAAEAAAACLRREPQARPTMSKVLRMLEGEEPVDLGGSSMGPKGEASGRRCVNPCQERNGGWSKGSLSQRIPHEAITRALLHAAERNPARIY